MLLQTRSDKLAVLNSVLSSLKAFHAIIKRTYEQELQQCACQRFGF